MTIILLCCAFEHIKVPADLCMCKKKMRFEAGGATALLAPTTAARNKHWRPPMAALVWHRAGTRYYSSLDLRPPSFQLAAIMVACTSQNPA